VQLAANIAVLASIYALISCGYVLIYRVSRVLSLAHGELMLLGAYGLYATASLFSGSPVLAVAMSALLAAVIGVLVYVLLMRRMTGESVLAAVLVTIALGILVRGITVLVWSTQERHPLNILGWPNPSLAVGENARISGVGLAFLPEDETAGAKARAFVEELAEQEGLRVIGWRQSPTDDSMIGPTARSVMPMPPMRLTASRMVFTPWPVFQSLQAGHMTLASASSRE